MAIIGPTHQVGAPTFRANNFEDFTTPVDRTMFANENLVTDVDVHFDSVRSTLRPRSLSVPRSIGSRVQGL
jgi:hypothetical protein